MRTLRVTWGKVVLAGVTALAAGAGTLLPLGTGVANAAVAPAAIWSDDGTSLYFQRSMVDDPRYGKGVADDAENVAKVGCFLVPYDKLFKLTKRLNSALPDDKKKKLPAQPRPGDPDAERAQKALGDFCEYAMGELFRHTGPVKAWKDAKNRDECVRYDFEGVLIFRWHVWAAADANPRYCMARAGDSVATPRPGNQLPRPAFTYSRRSGAGNMVALNSAGSYDPDGRIVAWEWRNGSTVLARTPNATVSLPAPGVKMITLRVFDDKGAFADVRRSLPLGNRTPGISWVSPRPDAVVGSNQPTLNAGAHDDDGDRLQFSYRVTGPHVWLDSGWVGGSWTVPASKLDPGTAYSLRVTVKDPHGGQATRTSVFRVAMLPTANDIVSTSTGAGYWQVASDGGVFSYGDARFHGSLPGVPIRVNNIFGMARTPTDGGYWLVGRDGGVFSFGDAQFHGSLPAMNIRVDNIVGMAATKDGKGYWLVGADGGVFSFGSARFYGSMGGQHLNAPIEAMAVTASGNGYWLVGRDGGVFSFGDAPFHGGMGGHHLNSPMVDIDTTPDGGGYYLTAEDGGVFTYGNARFHGSMGGRRLNGRVTSMGVTADGGGYWLSACDGGVFTFGNAPFAGSDPRYQCRGIG